MAHVLAAAGVTSADLRLCDYDSWNVSLPLPPAGRREKGKGGERARFKARVGSAGFLEMLPTFSQNPAEAEAQWARLRAAMRPLAAAATAVPAVALRAGDPLGAALTAGAAPAELRGSAFGLSNLLGGVATLIASLAAGGLWSAFGPPSAFLTAGGVCALVLAGLWLFVPKAQLT